MLKFIMNYKNMAMTREDPEMKDIRSDSQVVALVA
jgi:hypothetical protein